MAQQVVIAGGGVIGAATAYYLSARGVKPTVVEACTPACSASGKAGGFLAQDWCDSSALGPLARASFRLHAELAETLQEDTGYRTMATHSVAVHTGSGESHSWRKLLERYVLIVDTCRSFQDVFFLLLCTCQCAEFFSLNSEGSST